ncbi:hypothetical protein [Paenirhodobacter sp. CAU 1674]|nr:hypothetical protein [Paenirhodobacter sp. CAU 1674]MDF2143220.1 hypothetical protein [Paenirhodobacter sp. CAU 1674]
MQDLTAAAWQAIEWLMSLLDQDDSAPPQRREPEEQQDLPQDGGL